MLWSNAKLMAGTLHYPGGESKFGKAGTQARRHAGTQLDTLVEWGIVLMESTES